MSSLATLISGMLDADYNRAADATLRAVEATSVNPLVTQRLKELNAEAARLANEGKKLTPDNAVLRALIADMEPTLQRSARALDNGATGIQEGSSALAGRATFQMSQAGMDNEDKAWIRARWNQPDPAAVAALVDYADKPAWNDEIKNYPGLTLDTMLNQAVRGMVEGWGPNRVAKSITNIATTLPLAKAQILTRTLYMESYRSASAASQLANADILESQIRIEVLDGRTCLCCIALHGTKMRVGEKVNDHHGGRGSSITVVIGRPRTVQTGEQWFNALPDSERLKIAGPGNYDALQSGKAQLRDFVQDYTDPVFGDMVRQASLKSMGVR